MAGYRFSKSLFRQKAFTNSLQKKAPTYSRAVVVRRRPNYYTSSNSLSKKTSLSKSKVQRRGRRRSYRRPRRSHRSRSTLSKWIPRLKRWGSYAWSAYKLYRRFNGGFARRSLGSSAARSKAVAQARGLPVRGGQPGGILRRGSGQTERHSRTQSATLHYGGYIIPEVYWCYTKFDRHYDNIVIGVASYVPGTQYLGEWLVDLQPVPQQPIRSSPPVDYSSLGTFLLSDLYQQYQVKKFRTTITFNAIQAYGWNQADGTDTILPPNTNLDFIIGISVQVPVVDGITPIAYYPATYPSGVATNNYSNLVKNLEMIRKPYVEWKKCTFDGQTRNNTYTISVEHDLSALLGTPTFSDPANFAYVYNTDAHSLATNNGPIYRPRITPFIVLDTSHQYSNDGDTSFQTPVMSFSVDVRTVCYMKCWLGNGATAQYPTAPMDADPRAFESREDYILALNAPKPPEPVDPLQALD